MKLTRIGLAIFSLTVVLAVGCGVSPSTPPTPPNQTTCPALATKPEFSYILTAYAVSMFTVDYCGMFNPSTPATIATGYTSPQQGAEQMVADPLGRFVYIANLVSNASDLSTISMYTINSTTGVLTPTTPATVHTGWFPQTITIDPRGRFVYTANSDDSSVSMFTINQTTGVLTPTAPATVSTLIPGEPLSDPNTLTVDPTGKFLYVAASDTNDGSISMFTIDQTTGFLTPTSPATVLTSGIPYQVIVTPSGKFVYVVNNLSGGAYTDGVWQYTVNPTTGILTPNTPFAVSAGNGPTAIAIDPTSRFAYVVNRSDNSVSMYSIDATTGNLTLLTTPTDPSGTIGTGSTPFRIDFDPSGRFLYVTNEAGLLSVYTMKSDGSLTFSATTGLITGGFSTTFTTSH